jgi:spermidine/putrescine transport system permease protein
VQGNKKNRAIFTPLGSVTGLVYLFLYAPIIILVIFSFNNSRYNALWRGFTWRWYEQAFNNSSLIAALRMSLLVAFITALISVTIGTAAAIALARYRMKLRQAAEALVFLPVVIPEIVIGFATAALFGIAGIAFGVSTIVAAHVFR